MSTLASPLRRQLEIASKKARKIAEVGVRKSLEALAVHEPDPYRHMDEAQRRLRVQLRAQARQLGDGESHTKRGAYEIKHIVEKTAYDQWHRLLFAQFLLENNLLISPDHGVSVTLNDCEELSASLGLKDSWAVAARFAAVELPEIFRADDPAGAVEIPVEDRNKLIQLVKELPVEVFTASDSLGWCYQFWQSERKDEVNAAGNKIGADELPAVTQLFTEDYMVDFLLDNTLGAWHAGKVLTANPKLAETAHDEDELRLAVSLPGCPWKYLRFIKAENDKWTPAAGTFDGWPKTAKELTCLDPCMGSGHFVVAMFERLVALRMVEEKLDEQETVVSVISDNLFGLEIDPRCTQIGAFNLALAAWRRVGHCALPAMNLACSGVAPNAREADWIALAGDNQNLQHGMEGLYRLFKNAPVLGSLINPRAGKGDLFVADYHELQPLLEKALAQEAKDDTAYEMAVTARGLAKAAEILASQFTLVATNVPFLGRASQGDSLREFCDQAFLLGNKDLATVFLMRIRQLVSTGGIAAIVVPFNWTFSGTYKDFRQWLLGQCRLRFVVSLGGGNEAFRIGPGNIVNIGLVGFDGDVPHAEESFFALDVSDLRNLEAKALGGAARPLVMRRIDEQARNPDSRITLESLEQGSLLSKFVSTTSGLKTGDMDRFSRQFWEIRSLQPDWEPLQRTDDSTGLFNGRTDIIHWERELGSLAKLAAELRHLNHVVQNWKRGQDVWEKRGIAIGAVGNIRVSIYDGERFDSSLVVIVPQDLRHLAAIWCYVSSKKYADELRKIDSKLAVTTATLAKVPFDLAHWEKVAAKRYPHGLPQPFSSDPTQWLFNGHPKDSDQPLQVAVARLLGYRWPRQTGSSFPDCPALGPDGLESLADVDGIVCFSTSNGEVAAAERLRELLLLAYGKDWNATKQEELLAQVDYVGSTLEDWLRNGFFEQHCKLFHNRPFIWHIWDGHKTGFSALVNYHNLTHANLEKLTYAFLGDWIRRQQAAVEAGEAGSDARLQAAKRLQSTLKQILDGEPPYDIFVRWKPLAQQAIGWKPDINDGVRMNIRPFATADIFRKRVKIKWEKDRGKEPQRDRKEFPWFWGWDEEKKDFAGVGKDSDGNRWNDCHYTNEFKKMAREASKKK